MLRNITFLLIISFFLFCENSSLYQPIDPRFQDKIFTASKEKKLPYRFFIPEQEDSLSKFPLIIFLHGGSGYGVNNINQISGENWHGSHVWIQPEIQQKNPAFVIAPQLPFLHRWNIPLTDSLSIFSKMTFELIDSLTQSYPIDINKIYLTGQSLGGWGVWFLITKKPNLFAAAIPICGGGIPESAVNAKNVIIWAFHGKFDQEISVKRSREMVEAFKTVGANIKYTEYFLSGHSIWEKVYNDEEIINWLFNQSKTIKSY